MKTVEKTTMIITTELKQTARQWWIAYQRWSRDTLAGQSNRHDGRSMGALDDAKHALLRAAGLDYSDFLADRQRFLAAQEFMRMMEDRKPLLSALLAGQSLIWRPLPPWETPA